MASILRPCPPALDLALQSGNELWSADLFKFSLADGATTYYWTSWPRDLKDSTGQVWSSRNPWLQRSKWNVSNTMEVPSLMVYLKDLGGAFAGGSAIITQVTQGIFDGAEFLLSRSFMPSPNDTTSLGEIDLFGGEVAGIDLIETVANINVKGLVYRLDQYAPRNVIQIGCQHAFCDPDCTLARASFTASYSVGASPTSIFIPWAAAPATPSLYVGGTIRFTSGAASGSSRTIEDADATGITLAYPLYATPTAGDSFTAFQGCDKTYDSGSGRSCTDRANTQNFRGFEFTPPPSMGL